MEGLASAVGSMTTQRATIVGRGRRVTDALSPAMSVGLVTALNRAAAPSTALRQCTNAIVKGGQIGPRPPLLEWDSGGTPNGYQAAFGDPTIPGVPLLIGMDGHVYRGGGIGSYASIGGSVLAGFRGAPDEIHGSFYFATSDGLYKLDKNDGTAGPYKAGVQRGLNIDLSLNGVGAALLANATTAYRITWGYIDAQTYPFVGPPSGRYTITAGGTPSNVQAKSPIPSEIVASANPTGYFYQLWRAPGTTTGVPTEEYQLSFQSYLTATDISNGFIQVTDVQPDGMLGPALYTNPSVETAAQENSQAPICKTFAFWKGYGWYGNTQQRQQYEVAMLATPDTLGLNAGSAQVQANTPTAGKATYTFTSATAYDFSGIDTNNVLAVAGCTNAGNNGVFVVVSVNSGARQIVVTNGSAVNEAAPPVGAKAVCAGLQIAGVRYNAVWTEDIANKRYAVGVTGSVGTDVTTTSQSLMRCVNYNGAATVYAYDQSSIDTAPGQMLFESRLQSAAAFTVQAFGNKTSAASGPSVYGSKFAPDLNALRTSDGSAKKNRLHQSKSQEPEHCPLLENQDIGSGRAAILWLQPLRDSLVVFKEDGAYRVTTSDNTNFTYTLMSDSTILVGRPAVFNDVIYCVTTQGIAAISDAGQVAYIDGAIRPTVLPYLACFFDQLTGAGSNTPVYVGASPVSHLIYFAIATGMGDGMALNDICLVYSVDDGTWAVHESEMGDSNDGQVGAHVPFCPSFVVAGQLWWTGNVGDLEGGGAWTEAPLNLWQTTYDYTLPFGWEAPGDRRLTTITSVGSTQVHFATTAYAGYTPQIGDVLIGNAFDDTTFPPNFDTSAWLITAKAGAILTLAPYIIKAGATISTDFGSGVCIAVIPAQMTVEPYPFLAGDDNMQKQFTEFDVLMQSDSTADAVTIAFYNEMNGTPQSGKSSIRAVSIRSGVPDVMQLCARLSVVITHSQQLKFLVIEANSFYFEQTEVVPLA